MFSTGDVVGLLTVYGYVGFVVALSMLAKRLFPGCAYRKMVHILIGNIVFIWWIFDSRYIMAFLAAAPFAFLLFLATPYSPFRGLDDSFLKHATSQGHSLGLVYYAISWTILALLLFNHLVVAGVAIVAMSYGDGVGGIIGKSFGKRKIWKSKTLEGTLAVFLTTMVVTFAVLQFYMLLSDSGILTMTSLSLASMASLSLATGLLVAVVELFTPGEYDNLVVPLSTAALLVALGL